MVDQRVPFLRPPPTGRAAALTREDHLAMSATRYAGPMRSRLLTTRFVVVGRHSPTQGVDSSALTTSPRWALGHRGRARSIRCNLHLYRGPALGGAFGTSPRGPIYQWNRARRRPRGRAIASVFGVSG